MKLAPLFQNYELLADRADRAFQETAARHGACVRCARGCADCCHAVFGLFLIEAARLKQKFDELAPEKKKAVLLRCGEAERDLRRLEKTLEGFADDPGMQDYALARERVRCPLLDEAGDCMLYPFRPITCRVYGIPTRIQGKARVCGRAGFEPGRSYPVFDLDAAYRELYLLSRELLEAGEEGDPEKAGLLLSLPRALAASLDELIHEIYA